MARGRKPCEFCNGEYESPLKDGRNGFCLWLEVYPFNNMIAAMAQGNDEDGWMQEDNIVIQMNYCPVCGRKLEGV